MMAGPVIKRARSREQFVQMVEQALFEIEELRSAAEYDYEDLGPALEFVAPLEEGVRALLEDLRAGRHAFSDEDLPFMSIVRAQGTLHLPFKYLLLQINATHREGFDESGGD